MSLVEQWKYEECYKLETYRMGRGRLAYASEDVNSFEMGAAYLDVGCGRGEMLDLANSNGLAEVRGVETVPALCDGIRVIHGDACALPFADNSFDYLTCYDVLEHLVPGEEQEALDEFARVCRGVVLLSTNDRPSFLDHPNEGKVDLHINKRKQQDWHADIVARFPNAVFTRQQPWGDWHWRCPVE